MDYEWKKAEVFDDVQHHLMQLVNVVKFTPSYP